MANRSTPQHLAPERCFLCGGEEHEPTDEHKFWSNAAAMAEARSRDTATTHVFPSGATSPEAEYVAQHRPY